eukprot:PhF_6_TR5983/c0_g1_i2/m.8637
MCLRPQSFRTTTQHATTTTSRTTPTATTFTEYNSLTDWNVPEAIRCSPPTTTAGDVPDNNGNQSAIHCNNNGLHESTTSTDIVCNPGSPARGRAPTTNTKDVFVSTTFKWRNNHQPISAAASIRSVSNSMKYNKRQNKKEKKNKKVRNTREYCTCLFWVNFQLIYLFLFLFCGEQSTVNKLYFR